jgi:alkanesulfonate monooxygenase SsuD/methylene tetrahydromethanopterin reductase-like flavin-dependent oxidoreductase (luciferase family)
MLELSGFADDLTAFDRDGPAAISDRFLSALAAIGTPEQAAATVRRYFEAGATSPCVGGIAKTDIDATLEALAGT